MSALPADSVCAFGRVPLPPGLSRVLAGTLLLGLVGLSAPASGALPPGPRPVRPEGALSVIQIPDYPHPALYMRLSSDGHQLDSDAMVAKIARFSIAVIPSSPATEQYAARLAQIRALNPHIILLAYFPGDFMWDGSQYPVGNIYGDCWRLFQSSDWWLYATDGKPFSYFGSTFDLSRGTVTSGLANFIYNRVLSTGLWDGVFLDDFCESNYWKEPFAGQFIDQNRDGVADLQATFDPVWKAGTDSLASKLRALVGPDMPIVGNCAYGSKWTTMNGWMREDFPNQGDWTSNMFHASGGYLVNETNFRSPQVNFVYSTSVAPPAQLNPNNLQFMRYCLGSTLLGNGYFVFDPRIDSLIVADWWFDEYDGAGRGFGYLGQPLGGYYQQIGSLGTPEQLVNTSFESGMAPWSPYNPVGASLLDISTAAQGTTSVHMVIPSATSYTSQVHLQQTLTLSPRPWSVTFWAKAASPRHLWVQAQRVDSPFTIFAYQAVDVGTTWKQYQVQVNVTATCQLNLQLQFGSEAGDVWVDDVHMQAGASSVYRRDFQHGTVLVNNTTSTSTINLGQSFQRLLGTQDPLTNNGQISSSMTVPAQDALILMNVSADVTPPAAVSDLHMIGQPH